LSGQLAHCVQVRFGDASSAEVPNHRADLCIRVKCQAVVDAPQLAAAVHQQMVRFPVGAIGQQIEASNLPQFVGFILGEIVVVLLWIVIDIMLNRADAVGTVAYGGVGNEVPPQDLAE